MNPNNGDLAVHASEGGKAVAGEGSAPRQGSSGKSAPQSSSANHTEKTGTMSNLGAGRQHSGKDHEGVEEGARDRNRPLSSEEVLNSSPALDSNFSAEVTRVIPPSPGDTVWRVVVACSYAQGRTFDLSIVDIGSGRVVHQAGSKKVTRNIEDLVFEVTMPDKEVRSLSFQVRERGSDKIVDQWSPE
jgi:hypothetical protein